jgi:hypothetical protein
LYYQLPEDDGSSNTSQSSPSYGGVIAPGELDGSFCKTETFPTPFGKAPNVIVSLSGSDYEQWSATYSNVTPTSVKICGKMIKPPACSTDGWCLDAVAIAPTGIQWLAVGSGPETKSAVASLHFPEQRWVGERTIPIASFGYTGPAIKRSDIQKNNDQGYKLGC